MKLFLFLVSLSILIQDKAAAQTTDQNKNLLGVFDGRTPCQYFAKHLNEKVGEECIKIKWRLALYKNDASGNSGTYEMLGFIYKRDNPRKGKWHLTKGIPSDKNAIVYQLDEPGKESIFLLKGDDNVLFFLDDEKNILVGSVDFSYTLNRANKTSL